jgi:sugar lactone lactonase YvrE
MSVLVARDRMSAGLSPLPTTLGLTPVGCGDETVAFAGPPGGLTVAGDETVFVSIPAPRTIWRLEKGWASSASARPIREVTGGAERGMRTPSGVAMAPDGTLFVADTTGHRVWAIAPTGDRRVVAGGVYGYRDGPSTEALLRYPTDVAIGPDGTCYVADGGNHRIRTISPEGTVATLAGSIYDYGDGRGGDGRFRQPLALDVDADGICYVADTGNNAIRRVTPDGEVTTVAGSPLGGDADGVGADVGLRWPSGIVVGADGVLWVADHGNGTLRRIERTGASTTTLRLSGRRRPVAVALAPGGAVLVAAEVLDDQCRRETCLIFAEGGQ